jgi:hypothetical protein
MKTAKRGSYEKAVRLDMSFDEALRRFAQTEPSQLGEARKRQAEMIPTQGELELVHYETPECLADLMLDPSNETLWASQKQIADTFGIERSVATKHLRDIFADGELDENSVCAKFARTAEDGKTYQVQHYNLDAVLSVGYRVNSKKATAFRRWATQTLKDYIVQGYALDEQRLRDDPRALRELAAKVRALRADEKNIYRAVRDVFAFGSIDYESSSTEAKAFFARLQDKFTFAITGQESAEILLERADHNIQNMGLQIMTGDRPSAGDAIVAKNYLDGDELYALHILCEQFLLFVESRAIHGRELTMAEMSSKFDELIKVQGHPVFTSYKSYIAQKAKIHALNELKLYRDRITDQRRHA